MAFKGFAGAVLVLGTLGFAGCGGGAPAPSSSAQVPATPSASPQLSETPRPAVSPQPPAPVDPESPEAAVSVLRSYYGSIGRRAYGQAYRAWWAEGKASGKTFEEFRRGFEKTASVEVEPGTPSEIEGAAGSRYITIPVTITAKTTDGETQRFEGEYVLRRTVVDGATAAEREWHIHSAKIHSRR
jgi:hypothetical protein